MAMSTISWFGLPRDCGHCRGMSPDHAMECSVSKKWMLCQDVVCSNFLPNAEKYNRIKHENLIEKENKATKDVASCMSRFITDMARCCKTCWCERMCCGDHMPVEPTPMPNVEDLQEQVSHLSDTVDKLQAQIAESAKNGAEKTKAAGTNITAHDESETGVQLVYDDAGATEIHHE